MADTTAQQSINESTYGGVVDSYAMQYGIPTDVLRGVVRKVSGFDSQFSGPNGKGIANLDFHADKTFDPMNVGSSLDFMAKYISGMYKTTGNWEAAAKTYPGYETQASPEIQYDAMGNATGGTESGAPSPSASGSYLDRFIAFMKASAWTITFVLVGAVLIFGSVWILVKTSGETK